MGEQHSSGISRGGFLKSVGWAVGAFGANRLERAGFMPAELETEELLFADQLLVWEFHDTHFSQGKLLMAPEIFSSQMKYLARRNYRTLNPLQNSIPQ